MQWKEYCAHKLTHTHTPTDARANEWASHSYPEGHLDIPTKRTWVITATTTDINDTEVNIFNVPTAATKSDGRDIDTDTNTDLEIQLEICTHTNEQLQLKCIVKQ